MNAQTPRQPGEISPLAIGSAASSLLSVSACLAATLAAVISSPVWAAAIVALPLLGIVGIVLGGLALRQIGKSEGRIGGRPLALIGLFLGIMSATLQGAVTIGALARYMPIQSQVAPALQMMAQKAAAGDMAASRVALAESAGNVVDDGRLGWYFKGLEAKHGELQRVVFGIKTLGTSRETLLRAMRANPPTATPPAQTPTPLEMHFKRGVTTVYVWFDEQALSQNAVRILDVLVIDKDNAARALLPDGPGATLGRWLGLTLDLP
jgi:hypothetical protein